MAKNRGISNVVVEWYERKPDEAHGYIYRTVVRPEVAKFAIEMEAVLRKNDYKSGWDVMSVHHLFNRIKDEFEELQREYNMHTNAIDGIDRRDRLRHEAIDLANFCMFLSYWTYKEE